MRQGGRGGSVALWQGGWVSGMWEDDENATTTVWQASVAKSKKYCALREGMLWLLWKLPGADWANNN